MPEVQADDRTQAAPTLLEKVVAMQVERPITRRAHSRVSCRTCSYLLGDEGGDEMNIGTF